MNRPFPWRIWGALLCLALLSAACFVFSRPSLPPPQNPAVCMGVPILTQEASDALERHEAFPEILYNGHPAPADLHSKTLYLSAGIPEAAHAGSLCGALSCSEGYTLAFAPDERFSDVASAVADNHAFTLLAISGGSCAPLSVVFTPLPVFSITSHASCDYSDPYAEYGGSICVFEPDSASPKTSHADWHRRGMTNRLFKKGSWKLSLHNNMGHSRSLSFASLGADDDWILNSMGMDDLKLREKLIMDLYNGAQKESGRLCMSSGEYAEVVLDGAYLGLYLLQRRVDPKYLMLSKSRDIVLKGSNLARDAISLQEPFTIKSSPFAPEKTYQIAQNLFTLDDLSMLDLDSYLDMEVFVLFGAMYDNLGHRNTYYILSPQDGGYSAQMIPWDTDLSFGLRYTQNRGPVLLDNHETSLPFEHRQEYDAMKALYPDLDARIGERWRTLRGGALSSESISAAIDGICSDILGSGALSRDHALWGTRYEDRDTLDALRACIANRTAEMDAMYAP